MITLMRGPILEGAAEPIAPYLATGHSSCRLATGRQALRLLAGRLPPRARRHVLMPAYVAEGVIAPFRDAGMEVLFYALRSDLSPDPDDVASVLERHGGGGLFILVHYFGYDCASADLAALLQHHGTMVLHDAAHALYGDFPSGDFVLYSLNKFLPVTDGAVLVSRRQDVDVSVDEAALPPLPSSTLAAYGRHLELDRDLAKSRPEDGAMDILIRSGAAYDEYYSVMAATLSPCRMSKKATQAADAFPHGEALTARQRNRHSLAELMGSKLLQANPLTAPFCLAARIAGDRDAFVERAWAKGVHLATLMGRWDFLPMDDDGRFRVEQDWLRRHVLIPVSEFLTQGQMARIAAVFDGE